MTNTNQTSQRNSHLVLGGARSGKSSFAEQQALCALEACSNGRLNYIATATYLDDEMRERIAHHQQRRSEQWIEHEVPVELAEKLQSFEKEDVVLIDCLTLWLNNIIFELVMTQPMNRLKPWLKYWSKASSKARRKLSWSLTKSA